MADYVSSNILSQAYIHIETEGLTEHQVERIHSELAAFLQARGAFFLYNEVGSDVEVRDGSLKFYCTIHGSLKRALSVHQHFREGVGLLAHDAKMLAECVAAEGLFLSKSRRHSVRSKEARTGIVGNLLGIVESVEKIRLELYDFDAATSGRKLEDIAKRTARLIDHLRDPEDPAYIKAGLREFFSSTLPASPSAERWTRKQPSPESLAKYREERRDLLKVVAESL